MEIKADYQVAVTTCKDIIYITFARLPDLEVIQDLEAINSYPSLRLSTIASGLYGVYTMHPYEIKKVSEDIVAGLERHNLTVKHYFYKGPHQLPRPSLNFNTLDI